MIKIETIIELEKANPKRLREYCYYDGCPTYWTRKDIDESNIKKGRIPYYCSECDFRIYYTLRTEIKEEKKDLNSGGGNTIKDGI